jgi:hypothetical protein
MIGDPNNIVKMKTIYNGMKSVEEIDRSEYFNNYFEEVVGRIIEHLRHAEKIPYVENQNLEDQIKIADEYVGNSIRTPLGI